MEVVDYKRNGIRYRQVWFNRNTGIEKADADIIEFRESHVPLVSSLVPFRNGTISLARPLDEILSAFDKGFLYEVRRAEKENIVCAALSEAAFDLHELYRIYRDFCVSKGLDTISLDFFR